MENKLKKKNILKILRLILGSHLILYRISVEAETCLAPDKNGDQLSNQPFGGQTALHFKPIHNDIAYSDFCPCSHTSLQHLSVSIRSELYFIRHTHSIHSLRFTPYSALVRTKKKNITPQSTFCSSSKHRCLVPLVTPALDDQIF